MQHSHPLRPSINVIVCGSTSLSSTFIDALSCCDTCVDVSGYWDPTQSTEAKVKLTGLKKISEPFGDILKEGRYDAVFLCFSPQVQSKVLLNYLKKLHFSPDPDLRLQYPVVVLVPPACPNYNTSLLSDARNYIAFAMPFRKLFPLHMLIQHLNVCSKNSPTKVSRSNCCLPAHWNLGSVRSLHIRMSTTNPIKCDQYSWLCEPSTAGGGVLNVFGAGLIDLSFVLTGGLRIASVSCMNRTFDTEVSTNPNSIRRVSAEDYILVSAEFESRSTEVRGPVALFCLSSDLPADRGYDCGSQTLSTSDYGQLILNIELTGSSGRFVVPDTGDSIRWNPLQSITSAHRQNPQTLSGFVNGDVPDFKRELINGPVCVINSSSNTDKLKAVSDGGSSVTMQKTKHSVEVAYFGSGTSNTTRSSPAVMQQAWIQWLSQFSASLRSANPKQGLESLIASPGHWGYIQRVLKAIEKAARMRCWIDVATGERL